MANPYESQARLVKAVAIEGHIVEVEFGGDVERADKMIRSLGREAEQYIVEMAEAAGQRRPSKETCEQVARAIRHRAHLRANRPDDPFEGLPRG